MDKKEVYVEKDAVEHFRKVCRKNGVSVRECRAYNSHLVKFVVEDKDDVMGIKRDERGKRNETKN